MISGTFLDFRNPEYHSSSFIKYFPLGKLRLPSSPLDGRIHVANKHYDITFSTNKERRHIHGFINNVRGSDTLTFDLTLIDTNKVGLCIATPFKKKAHFYYNYKLNNLLASGKVVLGDDTFDFEGTQGVLDWGRGVWTYKNTWYWLSFSGHSDNVYVGANLGYGFGDTSAASENMVYERANDGSSKAIATKLDDVSFDIPKDGKGNDSFLEEWIIKSATGDIDLRFKPIINRHDATNLLIIKSIQNQVFGYFNGTITSNGKPLKIDNVLGFAERVYNAW
jgi:hypothetical protein